MDAETTLVNIFNILSKIGYPKTTNADVKDMATTILMGGDRTFLLSWILTEKSDFVTVNLDQLKGKPLEGRYICPLFLC